jgi:hypothetical protein
MRCPSFKILAEHQRAGRPAARVAEKAVANLRLARALAVLKAAAVLVLVVRAKIGALASRVRTRGGSIPKN